MLYFNFTREAPMEFPPTTVKVVFRGGPYNGQRREFHRDPRRIPAAGVRGEYRTQTPRYFQDTDLVATWHASTRRH